MRETSFFRIRGLAPATLLFLNLAAMGCVVASEGPTSIGSTQQPVGLDGELTLVFSDDFTGSSLNTERWTTCYWWDQNGCTNLSSNELQWYMPQNVTVQDGTLVLTARPEEVVGLEGRRFGYTSGIVTTGRYYAESPSEVRFDTTYGFFEMRAKVPAGQGLWPAFWLLPSSLEPLPEIDIAEVLGHDPSVLELHFHFPDGRGRKNSVGRAVRTANLSGGWHVFGLEWSPDRIVWYLDGREIWRYSEAANIPDEPMYMIVNLAVGGDWPGNPDSSTRFPARLEIDYVRAWQKP